MTNVVLPPATIGIIGGGQLGQMMALSAKSMGYKVGILDPTADSPAGQVSDFQIVANYDDQVALKELSSHSDILTYEFENVDVTALSQQTTDVPQGTKLLEITSNRLTEKAFIRDVAKVPVTQFMAIESLDDFKSAIQRITLPAILKTVSGGYDGHGQWPVESESDIAQLKADFPNVPLILEQRVAFKKELSIMVTRDVGNHVSLWPIAENVHVNHILKTSFAPAKISEVEAEKIRHIATRIADSLNLRGVLGIELFVSEDHIWVNELAPRPHNSGHYTIEGTNISQFEGHIRSIMGLPLPEIVSEKPALMLNLLGNELQQAREDLVNHPEWHFHDYGKSVMKHNRKMGHITVLGEENIKKLYEWSQIHGQRDVSKPEH
ncbi:MULTISPECIES: 5-(carboxyamino)imidazole ribonucleotide synthase [Leuconostoc]|uniref:N5-carboxyaminoimidazole ribonucleotide synthase n=2 Tax=Leuconostoc kimchii TaxID=136609 RepID=D5T0S2_LEUKI|nr:MULTISPECIES: 5-(carboxyamino)imidazole ribonucleotide synthase [Leuconostoc]ADG39871.1 phosphoribosylaminoimidazole carboxylase, ATPase subunit [Leuconostoc kimchii IMSNU 11154]AEJ30270.1 phosphoribosylaminoimidazole carboxylase ATPase subunit [Leuconostoc sp. C2]QBR47348.1 5-(carboxyamino)imidazole ribonucleotide synthase [Leuconostoc kimchii]